MILTGKHIALRELTVMEADITQRWRMSGRAKLLSPGAQTVEEQRDWIATRPAGGYHFIIELEATVPVGMLSLENVDFHHLRAEPAHFLIGEPDLVTLYGPAVIAADAEDTLFRYAFVTLGLHRLDGKVAADNGGMLAWNTYLGFQEEGRLRDHYFIDGHWQDAVCMGLLESTYRTITIPRLRGLIGA